MRTDDARISGSDADYFLLHALRRDDEWFISLALGLGFALGLKHATEPITWLRLPQLSASRDRFGVRVL